ncbi:hypothetical protein EDD18DRAFT_1107196 [Armillaria luteobubalina]|uniref:Uncharacterized protein n=1 Tax=Armillaria luteobubalina TaxID=153913 RepID=A0AA39TM93_9AGAR|nr:hypothetical protein EDD18DRAFT_1107196 [Armillaria luteobubalina]
MWRIAQHVGWTYSECHLVAGFDNIVFPAPRRHIEFWGGRPFCFVEDCGLYYVWMTLPSCKGCTLGPQHRGAPFIATKYYCKMTYRVPTSKIWSIGGDGEQGSLSTCNSPCPPSFPSNFALAKSSKISNIFCRETTYRFLASKGETFGGIKFHYKTMSNHRCSSIGGDVKAWRVLREVDMQMGQTWKSSIHPMKSKYQFTHGIISLKANRTHDSKTGFTVGTI